MSDPVLRARTAPEILQALAEALRSKHHPGRDCPPSTIPTPEALAAWLPECPRTIWSNFTTQIDALHFHFAVKPERPTPGITMDDYCAMMELFTFPHYAAPIRRTGDTLARALLGAHRVWAGIDEDLRGRHPTGLLVDAWQGRAIDTEPERRTKGILAAPFVQRHKQPYLPGMTGRPADALPDCSNRNQAPPTCPGWNPSKGENRPCWPCSMRPAARPAAVPAPLGVNNFCRGVDGGSRRSPGRAPVPNHIRRRAALHHPGNCGGVASMEARQLQARPQVHRRSTETSPCAGSAISKFPWALMAVSTTP